MQIRNDGRVSQKEGTVYAKALRSKGLASGACVAGTCLRRGTDGGEVVTEAGPDHVRPCQHDRKFQNFLLSVMGGCWETSPGFIRLQ